MVQRCCVPFCKSKVGDTDILGVKLKFHRMPHTADRFAEWAQKITDNRRLRPILSSGSRVCSKHFHKEDYLVKIPFGNNPLKKEVSPTIFHWNSAHSKPVSPSPVDYEKNKSDTSFLIEEVKQQLMDSTDSFDSNSDARNSSPELGGSGNGSNGNVRAEVTRKNTVIQQLLTRILELENEEKGMKRRIAELRAVNQSYEQQIRDLTERNNKLELSLKVNRDKFAKEEAEKKNNGAASVPDIDVEEDGSPSEKKIKLNK